MTENAALGKLYWQENCIGRKIVLAGKLYWQENCIGRKIVLAGKLYWQENLNEIVGEKYFPSVTLSAKNPT